MEKSIVVIKVKFGNTLRRFNTHANKKKLNYDIVKLREHISNLFGFTPDVDYTLTYIDEDKDIVTLHDDNDLNDIAAQSLNPVRINVSLNMADKLGGYYFTPSGISTPQLPFHVLNFGVSDILKYVPDRVHSTLSNILNDMALEAASSTLVLAELINTVQKVYVEKPNDVSIGGSDPDYLKNCLQDIKKKNLKKQYDVGVGGSNANYTSARKTNESVVKSCSDHSRVLPYDHSNRLCDVVHIGVICDGCDAYPITGSRFQSKVKLDYDLCNTCFKKTGQNADYIRMDYPGIPYSRFFKNSHDHISQNMQIPLSYGDAVIGTEGTNISYIRRASGANVVIQETRGISGEITVEINGSASQVQTAQQLIQNFIAEADQKQAAPPPAQGYNPYTGHAPAYPSQEPPAAHAPPPAAEYGGGPVYGGNYGY